MITEALLVLVIFVLLALSLFSGGGIFRIRRLSAEVGAMREELERVQAVNKALRSTLGAIENERARSSAEMCELVRDLETLRSAIAGSSQCRKLLTEKYGTQPGPELLNRMLAARLGIDGSTKRRLAHDLLVGEVGRAMLRALRAGRSIERASADAGVPVLIGKGQVKRLQVLGYLDDRLKLTERGLEALG